MRFALMIEGQEDVTWEDWQAVAATCERLGFEALFRSDHYLSVDGHGDRGALDAWTTIAALAATTRLRLGTLVSPATFRHPSVLAKAVVTADRISGGRVELGIGAGWWDLEHRKYGFPFPSLRERTDRLGEQLEIIRGAWGPGPFTFHGEHWTIEDLDAQPKPVQQPHPPLILGGSAGPRGAALAARFATEYNVFQVAPEVVARARTSLDVACESAGRDPTSLGLSLMNGVLIGKDDRDLRARADRLAAWRGQPVDLDELARTWLVGTPERIIERLGGYAAAGVQRLMLEHWLIDDDEALELFMAEVAPAFA
jgi:F420-dependent oxidoreductase-like protein